MVVYCLKKLRFNFLADLSNEMRQASMILFASTVGHALKEMPRNSDDNGADKAMFVAYCLSGRRKLLCCRSE